MKTDEAREKDIQAICNAILYFGTISTGDHGDGGEWPFCYAGGPWNASMEEVKHKPDCVYLIAKDLSTNS